MAKVTFDVVSRSPTVLRRRMSFGAAQLVATLQAGTAVVATDVFVI